MLLASTQLTDTIAPNFRAIQPRNGRRIFLSREDVHGKAVNCKAKNRYLIAIVVAAAGLCSESGDYGHQEDEAHSTQNGPQILQGKRCGGKDESHGTCTARIWIQRCRRNVQDNDQAHAMEVGRRRISCFVLIVVVYML